MTEGIAPAGRTGARNRKQTGGGAERQEQAGGRIICFEITC